MSLVVLIHVMQHRIKLFSNCLIPFKEAKSATMNIFRKINIFSF